MITSKQINTSELDFDTIKTNLITFLSSQDTLTDYQYDGSVMSVLLDILSYNTHYNSLYTNLAINEMFMDSASKRNSVISLAKLMGYRAKSITSARAKINISAIPGAGNTTTVMTIPAGTIFGSTIGSTVYKFTTVNDISSSRTLTSSPYFFNDVELVEGTRVTISYTNAATNNFVVPQRDADISTLSVRVFDNAGSLNSTVYTAADSIMNVNSTSNVFFVKQREDLYYEIYFGDGNFGSALAIGNVVSMTYSLSHGEEANRCSTFVYASGADSATNYMCTTTLVAAGGAPEETIDSIRFNAPKTFTAANRAVTADDYSAMLFANFSNVESVNVWGGQDNVPPVYGKVFIAAKPMGRDSFTTAEKSTMISTILGTRSIITVKPEFVDPQYLDIDFTTNVYYDPRVTTRGSGEIATVIQNTISSYAAQLGKFSTVYRHSVMSRMIDTAEVSIISNISNIMLRYGLTPIFNTVTDYSINLGNPISKAADAIVRTSKFYHANYADHVFIQNDGLLMKLYTEDVNGNVTYAETVGSYTVDGMITINKIIIAGLYDKKFEVSFTPFSYDVIPVNNYIVRLDPANAVINIIVDNVAMNASAAQQHIFSGSR